MTEMKSPDSATGSGVFLTTPTHPISCLSGDLALIQSCYSISAQHSLPAALGGSNRHIQPNKEKSTPGDKVLR